MSRSPVTCPRCGAAIADRRRRRSVIVRDDVELKRITGRSHTIQVKCPECGLLFDWLQVRLVVFELMAS